MTSPELAKNHGDSTKFRPERRRSGRKKEKKEGEIKRLEMTRIHNNVAISGSGFRGQRRPGVLSGDSRVLERERAGRELFFSSMIE